MYERTEFVLQPATQIFLLRNRTLPLMMIRTLGSIEPIARIIYEVLFLILMRRKKKGVRVMIFQNGGQKLMT